MSARGKFWCAAIIFSVLAWWGIICLIRCTVAAIIPLLVWIDGVSR